MYSPLQKTSSSPAEKNGETDLRPPLAVGILACLLIIAGCCLLIYLLGNIYSAYQQPAIHPFLLDIKQAIANKVIFSQEGLPPYIIGEGGAMIAAIVFFILFASLMISAAIGLIRAGTQILSPKFGYELLRLKQRLDALTGKIR